MSPIPFYMHDLGESELQAIAEVFSGPILTTGETVNNFEQLFADYLEVKHAIGLTSCTGALHLSLLAMGIGEGHEVITTPMTFIATSTAIVEAGAKPVFVDVEPETGNLDASKIEAAITDRTRAILPVHLYGQMCDMRTIREIADRHNLFIIEDSAHCIEGQRDGIKPGQLGDTACFSFYATKNLTCGEGGAVVTNDSQLAEKLKLLRSHGMTKNAADRERDGYQHWDMPTMGWKYNMDNIQAAMLIPQMQRLDNNWQKRKTLACLYEEQLSKIPFVSRPETQSGVKHAYHLYPIWIESGSRDLVIEGFKRAGIGAMVNYRAIHLLTYFQQSLGYKEGDFPIAEEIGNKTLSLPFYPTMPIAFVAKIAENLSEIILG